MPEVALWVWAVLAGLLVLSGLFSSSETALFSLRGAQRARAGAAAQRLLAHPRDLLVVVLIGNLVVNLLFFSFVTRLHPPGGESLAVDVLALVAILVFGEILPKTLGLRSRVAVARVGGPVLVVLGRALRPVRRLFVSMLDRSGELVGRFVRDDRRLTPQDLAQVLERGAEEGMLLDVEAGLLAEIVELDDIRVREIMTPRVDAPFLDLGGANRDGRVRDAIEQRRSWLPVVDGDPDHVVGRVRVRDLVSRPERRIGELVMPVKFVPEVASALDLLHVLREDRAAEAVVIDEWGGTAGIVTLEDVFEEIVGDLRAEGEQRERPVVPLGEGRYRVPGSLSIRDWNEAFGARVVPTEYETVGGFVTALLGRIPRAGDVARSGNLVMEVHEVRGRRVIWVDIGVEADAAAGAEGYEGRR